MLRDRLVCWINHPGIQKRLLSESDLTLAKPLELSQGMEVADHSSKEVADHSSKVIQSGNLKFTPVQKVQAHTRACACPKSLISGRGSCYRCGGQHKSHECHFREALCHICSKKGHIAWVCRNKDRQRGNKGRQLTKRAHIQEDEPETDEQEDAYSLLNVTSGRVKPIRVRVSLNGVEVVMEVDTGAALR